MADEAKQKEYQISFGDKNKRDLMAKLFSLTQTDVEAFKMKDERVYNEIMSLAKKAKLLDGLNLDNSSIGGNVDPIGGLEESQLEEILNLTMDLIDKIKQDMPKQKSDIMSDLIKSGNPYSTKDEEEKELFEKMVPYGIEIEEKEVEPQKNNNLDAVPVGVIAADKSEEEKEQEGQETQEGQENETEFAPTDEEKEEDQKIVATFTDEQKKEYYLKKYYLSGEKMLENIEHTEMFETLPANIQNNIRDIYLSCTQPSDLQDPKFLDEKMADKLGVKGEISGFSALHMAALGNTYVGYHIEEVGAPKTEGPEKNDIAMISFPAFTDDMPESIKDEVRLRGKKYIEDRIRDVVSNNSSYQALAILSPFDDFMESSFNTLEGNFGSSKEETSMKLYLKEMRNDIKGNVQGDMKNLDVSIDASDVNFKDPEQAVAFINRLRGLDKEAAELNVEEAIKRISSDYQINSYADAERVVAIKRALETACPNVDFDISYGNISSEERANINGYLSANGFHVPVLQNVVGEVAQDVLEPERREDRQSRMARRMRREIAVAAGTTVASLGIQVAQNVAMGAVGQQVVQGAIPTMNAATVNNTVNTYDPNDKNSILNSISVEGNETIEEIGNELEEEIEASEQEFDNFDPGNNKNY